MTPEQLNEARAVAGKLSEAQRRSFLRDTRDPAWEPPMWIRAWDTRLVDYYPPSSFGPSWLAWTPLGLAVRTILQEHPNG